MEATALEGEFWDAVRKYYHDCNEVQGIQRSEFLSWDEISTMPSSCALSRLYGLHNNFPNHFNIHQDRAVDVQIEVCVREICGVLNTCTARKMLRFALFAFCVKYLLPSFGCEESKFRSDLVKCLQSVTRPY